MRRLLFISLLTLCSIMCGYAQTTTVIRVLAIGNSFSDDAVENYLYDIANEMGVRLLIGNAFRSGCSLNGHWDAAVSDEHLYDYRKTVNGIKNYTSEVSLHEIITDEPWDVITFQQVSHLSGKPESYEPYLGNLINYAKEQALNPDVRFGFHMTWAYARNCTESSFANYDNDQMKMYQAIVDAAIIALNNHPELSLLIPSGTAIQNARTSLIGDNLNRDGYHLDKKIGRYIAACTWFEALTSQSPVGVTIRPTETEDLAVEAAQHAAHYAVETPFEVTDMSMFDTNENNIGTPIKWNFCTDAPTYNINGQRLATPQKGINIIGRRKIINAR